MARGEIRYTLSADGTPMRQELSKAESDLKKWSGLVGRVSRDIEGSEQRVAKEIAAVGAAVKKLGGEASLSEPQLRRVAERLGDLEAKGGKIPPHLKAMADKFKEASGGAQSLGKEISSIKSEKLDELAGKAGIMGRLLAALGPAGIAAAAAIALTVGAAGAVAHTLADSTKEAAAYAGKITDMSEASGIGAQALQVFEHAARMGGGSMEGMASAALKLKTAMVQAPDKFDALGLSVARLKELKPEQQLQAVADALKTIPNETERDAVALQVLGKRSSEIFAILRTDLVSTRAEMERLGLSMDEGTRQALDDLDRSFNKLGATWEWLWRQLGGAIGSSPALKGIFDDLADLVGGAAAAMRDAGPVIRELADRGFAALRTEMRGILAFSGLFVDSMKNIALALVVIPGMLDDVTKAMGRLTRMSVGAGFGPLGVALMDLAALNGGAPKQTRKLPITRGFPQAFADGGFAGMNKPDAPNLTKEQIEAAKKAAKEAADAAQKAWWDAADASWKAWDDFYKHLADGNIKAGTDLISQAWARNAAAMPVLEKQIIASIPKALPTTYRDPFNPSKPKQFNLAYSGALGAQQAMVPPAKPLFDWTQGLQVLTNVLQGASAATGKLGAAAKGLASAGVGALGLKSGLDMFQSSTLSGITGLLGKAGGIGAMVSSGLSVVSGIFGLFKKKPKEPPPPPPPPKEHVDVDSSLLASNLGTAFGGVTAKSAEDIRAQSKILSLSFWQVFTEQGLVAAATSFKDVFDNLRDTFGSLGGDAVAEAILGPIASVMDKMENEQFRGAAESAQAYSQILKELGTKDVPITLDQFRAFEQQLMAVKAQAEAGGATTKESFAVLSPYLQEIITRSKQYGFELDDNTKALIDQAKAAGVAFPLEPIDRLIAKLDEFLNKLLGLDGKSITYNVRGTYTKDGQEGEAGRQTPGFARGSAGLRDFGDETEVRLHGREAVLTEPEYVRLTQAAAGGGSLSSGGGVAEVFSEIRDSISDLAVAVSRTEPASNVTIAPQVAIAIDAGSVRRNQTALIEQFQDEAASAIRRGTSPILAALRDRGYRTARA